jgi:hypothetical protein
MKASNIKSILFNCIDQTLESNSGVKQHMYMFSQTGAKKGEAKKGNIQGFILLSLVY